MLSDWTKTNLNQKNLIIITIMVNIKYSSRIIEIKILICSLITYFMNIQITKQLNQKRLNSKI